MSARLRVDDVELADLATWIDSRDYGAAYLDPATGEVYPAFEGEVLGEDGEPVDLDEVDWVPIGGSSRGAYRDMEDFADAVGDPAVARQLWSALGGKGAFRRFRDQMDRQPEEIRYAWLRYRDLRSMSRAVEWLRDEQLVVEPEAAARAEELAEAARRTLDLVRVTPAPGARLILLNGMPGLGNSTLADRYAAEHPGVLCLDPDRVRAMIGGDPAENAEPARLLALAMATAHLRSGHDVVVPRLLARLDQLERFAEAAAEAGAELVEVMLADADGTPAQRLERRRAADDWQEKVRRPLTGSDGAALLASFERGLAAVADARPATRELISRDGDPDRAYADLLDLLGRCERPAP